MNDTPSGGTDPQSRSYRSRAVARATTQLNRGGRDTGSIEIGEVSNRLDQLGPLYLLMAVACVAVSPLSGIPFVTATCGLSIALLSAQLLLGRRKAWLPGPLRRRMVPVDRLYSGLGHADRVAGTVEIALRRRWVWLTRGPVRLMLLSISMVFGLTMPFLEVIPFAGTILASVVLVIALALIARDGLAALVAGVAVCALLGITGALIVR